jgi:hypothetical protein
MHTWQSKPGVGKATVYHLDLGITKFPRFKTLMLLAQAVGLTVTIEEKRDGNEKRGFSGLKIVG